MVNVSKCQHQSNVIEDRACVEFNSYTYKECGHKTKWTLRNILRICENKMWWS